MKTTNECGEDLRAWLTRVKANETEIFVREGAKSVALSELPPERWAYWVSTWLVSQFDPVAVVTDVKVLTCPKCEVANIHSARPEECGWECHVCSEVTPEIKRLEAANG